MKNIIIALFISVSPLFVFAQESSTLANHSEIKSEADRAIQECVDFKESLGISAGIYKNGEVIWQSAAGIMNLKKDIKANAGMVHRTASITKPMTAIAIMQLYEKGLLDLDDPIQKFIPDFPNKKSTSICIRHLLSHSSGIKNYKTKSEAYSTDFYPTLLDAIEVFKNRTLSMEPGSGFKYVSYGYVLLGEVIQKASGVNYRDYMKENIWDKAGMSNTDVEIYGKKYDNKSRLYTQSSEGTFIPDKDTDLSIKIPGGGVHSTAEDLLRFAEAVIENKLISARSLQLMIKNTGLKKKGNPYGFGWYLYGNEKSDTGDVIGHSGTQSGCSAQILIFLDQKVATVALSNTAGKWPEVFGLCNQLATIAINSDKYKKSIARSMYRIIQDNDLNSAKKWFDENKSLNRYAVNENDMNMLGYLLLQENKKEEAVFVFSLNSTEFPNSWNAYDSLAEAHHLNDNRELAILNYNKSLELNPDNKGAKNMLKKLE